MENLPGFSGGRCPPYEKGDATVLILPARFVEDTIEMLANRAPLATMAGRVHVVLFLFSCTGSEMPSPTEVAGGR